MNDATAAPSAAHPRHVLLAGGGSGGHVFPALAVGRELARRGWRVSYAGNAASMEERLATAHGVPFVRLAARPVVGRGPLARGAALALAARSAFAARGAVRRLGVDAVVATGGYAAVPAALGGAWAGRPLVLVEPNARPGAANRWLSRLASAAAVAAAETGSGLACRSFVAGVPVRDELFAVPGLAAAAPPRLLVLGGSQGSQRLNELLPAAVTRALERLPGLAVVHQCGSRNLDAAAAAWSAFPGARERVELVPFVADVAGALTGASLVLSRAGAITLAELAAAGRPALLLPLALAGAHQVDNARRAEAAGAAFALEDAGLTGVALGDRLADLLGDPDRLVVMGRRARALARPGAAAAIADEVERLTGGAR